MDAEKIFKDIMPAINKYGPGIAILQSNFALYMLFIFYGERWYRYPESWPFFILIAVIVCFFSIEVSIIALNKDHTKSERHWPMIATVCSILLVYPVIFSTLFIYLDFDDLARTTGAAVHYIYAASIFFVIGKMFYNYYDISILKPKRKTSSERIKPNS